MGNTKTRDGIFVQLIEFIRSFSNPDVANNANVSVGDLNKDEKIELAKVLKASGNIKSIEAAMGMGKYKAEVDTNKAMKDAATKNEQKVVEDKTRDNK